MNKSAVIKLDIEDSLRTILNYVGDDSSREGLRETPKRITKSWDELFAGYNVEIKDLFKTFSEGSCDEMVVLSNIDFFSTCEHHFLPFFGTVSIGYLPNSKVIGVSKLARITDAFSRRLQIQENMTSQIADAIEEHLSAKGVIVVVRAQHLCMVARGVKRQNAKMTTSAVRGVFKNDAMARAEFFDLIKE